MGVWTAGDMNGFANKFLALKYRNSSSISPGIDIDNALWTLEGIARDFDQVIIYGYPPFLKDLVDQMPKKVIRGTEIKLVAYGEPFSESWREYVAKKLGAKEIHRTVASLLGSSEGGLVGSEMAGAIVVRRAAKRSQELRRELFGSDLIPSLVQFSPMSKYMEVVNLQLVMTNKGGLPLIRYDTRDVGGLLDAETIDTQFKKVLNKSYFAELKRLKISHTNLPYVYLFGRSDYSATIYGITISPDQIKDVLVGSKALNSKLTSRFTLKTVYNERGDQYLELVCELRKNIGASGARSASLGRIIANKLTKVSTEYGKLLSSMGERVFPKVVTKRYGDTQYFSSKNKQKYLI